MGTSGCERSSRMMRLAYGAPAVAAAAMGIVYYVHLPKFYADQVQVSLSLLGAIVLASRILDAVLDPFIGQWSDCTSAKWGRRKSWMIAALLPLVCVFTLLTLPAASASPVYGLTWFAVFSLLFFVSWSAFSVPYEAWGAELSFDYHERTEILSYREGGIVLGTLLAAVVPVAAVSALSLPAGSETTQAPLFWSAVFLSVLLIGASVFCFFKVREREWKKQNYPSRFFRETFRILRSNSHFRVLFSAFVIGGIGAALPATLIFFFVEYVLQSDKASLFLFLYFGVGVLFVPFWVRVSKKMGKRDAWLSAIAINTGAFAGVLFLGPGDELAYGVLVAASAIGYGGTLVVPASMEADVIDYDEWQSGKRREGLYVGAWSVGRKIAAASGAGFALPLLEFVGYQPQAVQSPQVITALKALYAGVPCFCNMLAFGIAWRYSLSEVDYKDIRKEVESRLGSPASPVVAEAS